MLPGADCIEENSMSTAANKRTLILIVAMSIAAVGSAFAAEQAPTKGTEPSQQAREQMAKMHEEMAACLRSEKSFADCQTQMHQRCMTALGAKGCPMMGAGMQRWNREPASTDQH
jgi:uncharacterized protein HemX